MSPQDVEHRYLALLDTFNRKQWENYVLGAGHDLRTADESIYRSVRDHAASDVFTGRRAAVWNAIVTRELVDRHPEVSHLRTRLDLDSCSRYRRIVRGFGHSFCRLPGRRRPKPHAQSGRRARRG